MVMAARGSVTGDNERQLVAGRVRRNSKANFFEQVWPFGASCRDPFKRHGNESLVSFKAARG